MTRVLTLAAVMAVGAGLVGCASAWDTMTSRRFRDKPFGTVFQPDDPIQVLRDNPTNGDARAWAFQRLTEPAESGRPGEQEFVVEALASAAASDPSPWVRIAAVDALGKFKDPRAAGALVAAYHQATGRPSDPAPAADPLATPSILPAAAGRPPTLPAADRFGLTGPQGFTADQVATLRGRAVDALARSGRPEAVAFLAEVAAGTDPALGDDPASRDFVRQRAVAGLGAMRTRESVAALAQVLAAEHGKDVTLTNLAHEGLVSLTGRDLPPDPQKWHDVVQAGFDVAPAPGGIERATGIGAP